MISAFLPEYRLTHLNTTIFSDILTLEDAMTLLVRYTPLESACRLSYKQ